VATDDPRTASMPGRYASALFELAKDQGQITEVESKLKEFQSLMDDSDDLRRLVKSPIYKSEQQLAGLDPVLTQAGIDGLAGKFIRLIAKNRRLFAAEDMIATYAKLAADHRGEVVANVATAIALTDEQISSLKSKLSSAVGKDVNLDIRIDPTLLGGLIVKVGSRMIDSSLRTKLATLKMRMKEVG